MRKFQQLSYEEVSSLYEALEYSIRKLVDTSLDRQLHEELKQELELRG